MQEIVDTSQMSKGAFYHYFKNKEQIFLEIVEYIYSTVIDTDYKSFRRNSLHEFYEDYLSHLKCVYQSLFAGTVVRAAFDLNVYSLVFDAIRFFPQFKRKMIASSSKELAAWREVVKAARKSGEIGSSMTDEQIADLFIHTSSGVGMNDMMIGNTARTCDSLRSLWDGFYTSIKA